MFPCRPSRWRPLLLLVDDDKAFLARLARAMEQRGFDVRTAESVAEGIAAIGRPAPPAYAVVDMRLEDGNGLDVVAALQRAPRRMRAPSC